MTDKKHTKKPEDLRSARWFAPDDLRSFGHRSRMNQMGYDVEEFRGGRSSASSTPGRTSPSATRISSSASRT